MLTDIVKLDKLYDANLDYFRTLEVYIAAGRAKLKELDEQMIPALAKQVEGSRGRAQAQKLRDLRAARDDLERRVHDLLLTRQVTMQALPSIRLVQENDKSLVTKINSTIANTVPLLAPAAWPRRSRSTAWARPADSVKAASDLTNELLKNNAENLQTRQRRGAAAGGARRVRHRDGQGGERQAGRHHQREPADRRRGQAQPGGGGAPAAHDGSRAQEDTRRCFGQGFGAGYAVLAECGRAATPRVAHLHRPCYLVYVTA